MEEIEGGVSSITHLHDLSVAERPLTPPSPPFPGKRAKTTGMARCVYRWTARCMAR